MVIKSRVIDVKDKTIRFLHVMYKAENMQEVATTEVTGVHLDRKTRKSCPLPEEIKEQCEGLFEIAT